MSEIKQLLPPDPDGYNEDRAYWAMMAIEEFERETGCGREDSISDLLTALRHFCDRNEINFETEALKASRQYRDETTEE